MRLISPYSLFSRLLRQGAFWVFVGLIILLLTILLRSPILHSPYASRAAEMIIPAKESRLFYLQSSEATSELVQGPISDREVLTEGSEKVSLTKLSMSSPACETSGLFSSPNGKWIIAQGNCEAGSYIQAVDAQTSQVFNPMSNSGHSLFLGWTPFSELILRVDQGHRFAIFRVNPATGETQQLPVPEMVYHVAFSPDGLHIIYSLTWGLGYGSQTWIADIDGQNAHLVLDEPDHIIAFANWSPTGDKIAYLRWVDTNIPFTVGELWVMSAHGQNPTMLSTADAGHGYAPAWSPDGSRIAFVRRENGEDVLADQNAARLQSNIFLADITTGTVSAITSFKGALTEAPVWSPDGEFISFNSTGGGTMDIWVYEVQNNDLLQITQGINAWFPIWLPEESE
ncbi:MAG: PD40 domain-containing protein [Anaerolineales bacterium]|nr:PD40 domain-containing protein [Anaerolineales bacterium]